ncbi:hypothetical protein [Enterococcus massiliensis]|nr:hypothetical protein [Enterococcus massiliensis]
MGFLLLFFLIGSGVITLQKIAIDPEKKTNKVILSFIVTGIIYLMSVLI